MATNKINKKFSYKPIVITFCVISAILIGLASYFLISLGIIVNNARMVADFSNDGNYQWEEEFAGYVEPIIYSDVFQQNKEFNQHANTSVYEHSIQVAYVSYKVAKWIGLDVDYSALCRGAVMHDLFLYDWHSPKSERPPHHATMHPIYAAENAAKYFGINEKERNIIESHMYPYPPTRAPHCSEAVMVTFADKWCTFFENMEV